MKRSLILVAVSVLLTSLAPPAFGGVDDLDAGGGAIPAAALVATGDDTAAASWEAAHPAGDFEDQLGYQQRFRSQFDFLAISDADLAVVMAESSRNGSFESLGLHLTDAEFLEMSRRSGIAAEADPIAEAVQDTGMTEEDSYERGIDNEDWMGADFGGAWIDQMDGGKLKVAIKAGPGFSAAAQRADTVIDDLVAEKRITVSDVQIVPVTFSLAELTDAADAFFDGPHAKNLEGFVYTPSVVDNALVIKAEPPVLEVAEKFAKSYAPGMVIVRPVPEGATTFREIGAPTAPHDEPHAGVAIDITKYGDSGPPHKCTWGFTARTTSYAYAIVAAHCLPGHTRYSTYQGQMDHADVRSGGQILSGYSYTYGYNGERGEIGRAQITRPENMDDANCYHYYYDCYHTISRRLLTSETVVGTTQCASLRVANYMGCGGLVTNNYSGTVYGIQRKWMREVNYAAGESDSGSGWKPFAYAQRELAMGIASFADGSTVLVTHMYYVETKLNVTTCGTSGVC